MSYRIAGIDVHKKMLAVVVSDVEIESEYQFERRMFGSNPEQLRSLAAWLLEQEAEEVVMESTAQYWKPVWETLERYWKPIREKREGAGQRSGTLHLAQAESNRARRGRKKDFADAERLVKRLVARELTLLAPLDGSDRVLSRPRGLLRATVTCGGYSIRLLTPRPKPKEASSRSFPGT
jgi:Transposase